MDFDGLFDGTKFGGDLLIESARDDMGKDLTLPRWQASNFRMNGRQLGMGLPGLAVLLFGPCDRREQVFVGHRLGQEIDRARSHRLHAHGNATLPGQKNDRPV